jgi:hypothetical protein
VKQEATVVMITKAEFVDWRHDGSDQGAAVRA